MEKQALLTAGIDFESGVRRFCGKRELYEKYLSQFPKDKNYEQMMQALKEKRYDDAFLYAHALKGIAANLSLQRLYEETIPLTEALRSEKYENLERLSQRIEISYHLVIKAIS